jgi:hypothetical protein
MKHSPLAFALIVFALLSLSAAATEAKPVNDRQAIRATITDYIDACYFGDAGRMERSLHPHYLKHVISGSGEKVRMTEKSGLQMVQSIRALGPREWPAAERKTEITVLDVAGDIASAKLVTANWTDYLTLSKWNGQWKIVSVVLREND